MGLKVKTTHTQGLIPQSSTLLSTNLPFGNIITTKTSTSFRLYLKNVSGIYKANSWDEWKELAKQSSSLKLDVVCMTKSNLNWNTKLQHNAQSLAQRSTKNCQSSTSSNTSPGFGYYQPGGTATAIMGNATGQITYKIIDKSSMGRWSGFRLHTNGTKHINIITVYQATKTDGILTNYMQQINTLKQQGQTKPEPRKQLLADLQLIVQSHNKSGDLTIILMDANDGLYNKQSLLPTFLHNTNLVPLISNPEMHPPTHTRGSYCIDFIIGSPPLVQYIESSGITGFFEQPWPNTDHRGLFIDINMNRLFGATLQSIPEPMQRRDTNSDTTQHIRSRINS
jgi:hypothetical protein